jgi:hypothetical protein
MDPLITKQIQGVLENNIFNKIIALNLNIPNPILRAVISRVAEVGAIDIVKQVTQASNKQLTDIPKNIIGTVNPVTLLTAIIALLPLVIILMVLFNSSCLHKQRIKL